MANQALDYFDDDDLTSIARRWIVSGSTVSIMPTGGRGGRACVRQTDSSVVALPVPPHATYHFGFAFIPEAVTVPRQIAAITDGAGNVHLWLAYGSTGKLLIQNTSFATLWTGSTSLLPFSENYVWWSTYCHASSGTSACYVNGSSTPDATVYTGATKGAGSAVIGSFAWAGQGNAIYWRWHDFVANDGSGSAPDNTRWGDTKVFALRPNATGHAAALSVTGAASNHAAVGESGPPDGDTSYVSGTSGRDSYNASNYGFTALSTYGCRVRLTARKTDAATRTVAGGLRVGSTYYDGTPVSPGTSYGDYDFPFPQNPATSSAWTQADLEAAEITVLVA